MFVVGAMHSISSAVLGAGALFHTFKAPEDPTLPTNQIIGKNLWIGTTLFGGGAWPILIAPMTWTKFLIQYI